MRRHAVGGRRQKNKWGRRTGSEAKRQLSEPGIEARASSPDEISARLRADTEKWRGVIGNADLPRQ
jgi:hypothetical protein